MAIGEFVDEKDVSDIVKKANPCLFNYSPPEQEKVCSTPSQSARKSNGSAKPANKTASTANANTGHNANTAVAATQATSAAASGKESSPAVAKVDSASSNSARDEKKRKRVQPTYLGPSDGSTLPTKPPSRSEEGAPRASQDADAQSDLQATPTAAPAEAAGSEQSKTSAGGSERKKKRIAPVLIATYTDAGGSVGGDMVTARQTKQ